MYVHETEDNTNEIPLATCAIFSPSFLFLALRMHLLHTSSNIQIGEFTGNLLKPPYAFKKHRGGSATAGPWKRQTLECMSLAFCKVIITCSFYLEFARTFISNCFRVSRRRWSLTKYVPINHSYIIWSKVCRRNYLNLAFCVVEKSQFQSKESVMQSMRALCQPFFFDHYYHNTVWQSAQHMQPVPHVPCSPLLRRGLRALSGRYPKGGDAWVSGPRTYPYRTMCSTPTGGNYFTWLPHPKKETVFPTTIHASSAHLGGFPNQI